ncbi:MAG: FecR domain-containing protein [Deltaproteobacteria bacterium]|nr:FecR domain-containing protein [Deltaproteobacteria bacterium]
MNNESKKDFYRKKILGGLLFSLVLVLCLTFIGLKDAVAGEAKAQGGVIGWVTKIQGEAAIFKKSEKSGRELRLEDEVHLGDEIKTFKDATLTIQFEDDSVLSIGSGSKIAVTKWVYNKKKKRNKSVFRLATGRVRGLLNSIFGSGSGMEFRTATSVAGVKGSDISIWIEDGITNAAVTEGHGFIRHKDKLFAELMELEAGAMASSKAGERIKEPVEIPEDVFKKINTLHVERNAELMKKLKALRDNKKEELFNKRDAVRDIMKRKLEQNKYRD